MGMGTSKQMRELEETKRLQAENELIKEKNRHAEEMKKIENKENGSQRKDTLSEKAMQLEHERLIQGQEKVFSILKDTFAKVQPSNMNDVALSAVVLQSIQPGKPVDKDVLQVVQSKVAPSLPHNISHVVETVLDQFNEQHILEDEELTGESNEGVHPNSGLLNKSDD